MLPPFPSTNQVISLVPTETGIDALGKRIQKLANQDG